MAVPAEMRELLAKYLDKVIGTEDERLEKRVALLALDMSDRKKFIELAATHVKNEKGNCPWPLCRYGECAPPGECS